MVKPQRQPQHPPASAFSVQLKRFLVQLLQQRPLIFWGGVWAIALMLISGSIATLLDPTVSRRVSLHELFPSPQPIAAPSPTMAESAPPPSTSTSIAPPAIAADAPTIPYRSLGAIVIGCGLGSVLISQLMNRSPKPQRLHRAVPQPPAPAPKPPEVSAVQPPQSAVSPRGGEATAPPSFQMPPALTTPRSKRAAQSDRAVTQTAVTVMPPDASHSLDWDENSLVNSMDLRKQRSLSSWM